MAYKMSQEFPAASLDVTQRKIYTVIHTTMDKLFGLSSAWDNAIVMCSQAESATCVKQQNVMT